MISEENLGRLYEGIIDHEELTTKLLNEYGFCSGDLTKLVKEGIIERISRGHYSLLSVDDLYNYGKTLISLRKYGEATLCFKRCYELDPYHINTCLSLFLIGIKKKIF